MNRSKEEQKTLRIWYSSDQAHEAARLSRSPARRWRSTARVAFQAQAHPLHRSRAAPANAWPQFRGSYALTGISSTTIAPAPKLAWAWEGGEAFDSSPAIVDDVVYVGTATGELIAVGLADGKLRWRYKAGEAIGESSPAVANGRVFIGDLIGVVHAVNVADGKPIWTFKTQSEIKSSPVVVGDVVLMGSYDGKLYGLDAADRQAAVGVHDRELRARHAVRRERRRALRRLRRGVSRRRRQDRQGALRDVGDRVHRRVGRARQQRRLLRHLRQSGARARSRRRARCCGATSIPIASFRSTRRPR